jgi:hypothetical protein
MKAQLPTPATLDEGISRLKAEGFKTDLTWDDDCLYCSKEHIHFEPNLFKIHQHFEFSNPDSSKIHLYAVSSEQYHVRGHLTSVYGSEAFSAPNIIKK